MAIMIPASGPRECTAVSREVELYNSLKRLPDSFYVVHSLSWQTYDERNDIQKEGEADFVLFSRQYGIMCIEAKAGRVSYSSGEWHYGSGRVMAKGGPFKQARRTVYGLRDVFRDRGLYNLLDRTKIHSAVWFPGISKEDLDRISLPPEGGPSGDKSIILTRDDLANPLPGIQRIFRQNVGGVRATSLTQSEADTIFREVISPEFDLVPSLTSYTQDNQEQQFVRLLESQRMVLDFIEDESFVAIQGSSGTGKTLVAVEHAKHMANIGKKVLFLCYNTLLAEQLKTWLKDEPLVTSMTLSSYCRRLTGSYKNLVGMCEQLLYYEVNGNFPYQCVIIDEAQDFGDEAIIDNCFFEILHELLRENGGSLYVFYDKEQRVQAESFPPALLEAETRLNLRVNVRNTQEIARSSQAAIGVQTPDRFLNRSVEGERPTIYFCGKYMDDRIECIDAEIARLRGLGVEDIVILTCGNRRKTGITPECDTYEVNGRDELYYGDVPVYSIRRFKGLEADAIILIKVTADCWDEDDSIAEQGGLIYVGASRAKRYLSYICEMDRYDCYSVLKHHYGVEGSVQDPQAYFAEILGADVMELV